MPGLYAFTFEVLIFILFGLCLRHAWRAGLPFVLRLLAALLFGIVLELATLRQLNTYRYGQFLVMIADLPLAIGVGWSVIIYASMLYSDATSLPDWARPVLDGLLALSIDLVADTVAVRLGLWDWGQGLHFEYFGVPFANFFAWFWVVASFSTGNRWLFNRHDRTGLWLSPVLGLGLGLLSVVGTNAFIVIGVPRGLVEIVALSSIGASAVLMLLLHPQLNVRPLDSVAIYVPVALHAYFLIAGLLSGALLNPPALLLISFSLIGLTLFLHWSAVIATVRHYRLAWQA